MDKRALSFFLARLFVAADGLRCPENFPTVGALDHPGPGTAYVRDLFHLVAVWAFELDVFLAESELPALPSILGLHLDSSIRRQLQTKLRAWTHITLRLSRVCP